MSLMAGMANPLQAQQTATKRVVILTPDGLDGDNERAKKLCQRAVELDPSNAHRSL